VPDLEDDGPSTLDLLRARSAQLKGEAEGDEGSLTSGVDDGDDVGEVVVEPRELEADDYRLEIDARHNRRRRDQAVDVDLANLQVLSAVDGFDVGGLLGVVQDWATGQTVTVNAGRLYRMINGIAALRVEAEALLHKARSHRLATGIDGGDLTGLIAALTAELSTVENQSVELTAVPVSGVLSTVPQLVGFVSRKLGKEVTFETTGGDVLVDRAIMDAIGDPIRQLVVNAVRHGIEKPGRRNAARKPSTGRVTVDVKQLEDQIQVTVSDDGAGVDWDEVGRGALEQGLVAEPTTDPKELLPVIFSDGFSTADETELGGSGDGLAIVARTVESLFGRLSLRSEPGRGTIARFTVPTSQALQRIVIIEDGGLRWGLPDASVDQIVPLAQADVDWDAPQPQLEVRGVMVPLYAISQVVGGGTASLSEVLVVSHRTGTAAFAVGNVEMVREVATKELGPLLQGPQHITGAALLGAGDVVLVLDPYELVERAKRGESSGSLNGPRLLIVDDSAGVRAVVGAALSSSGFVTSTVDTVAEALEHISKHHVDAFVVDYQMPDEDGISLVRKIRANDQITPIVILSGVADVDDQRAALAAGADAVLDKSDLREGALAATLHHLLTVAERQAVETSASAPVDLPVEAEID
jgi:chemosensory pili system protein ChpA (sensor histidine kinase/response regulator)